MGLAFSEAFDRSGVRFDGLLPLHLTSPGLWLTFLLVSEATLMEVAVADLNPRLTDESLHGS